MQALLQKESFKAGGCSYLDHTAMLKGLTHLEDATTLFIVETLHVFFLTRHYTVKDVSAALNEDIFMQAILLHPSKSKSRRLSYRKPDPRGQRVSSRQRGIF